MLKESQLNWFYEVKWRPQMRQSQQSMSGNICVRSWLIFADCQGIGQQLATLLQSQGDRCILVFQGKDYRQISDLEFKVDPASPSDFQLLLMQTMGKGRPPLRGVIHLWSLDVVETQALKAYDLEPTFAKGCGSTLHLVQSLLKTKRYEPCSLWLVTQGSQAVGINPTSLAVGQASLWGLGKVIAIEHPELNCILVDLDPAAQKSQAQDLFEEVWVETAENQVAFRDQVRYVATLVQRQELQLPASVDGYEAITPISEGIVKLQQEEPVLLQQDGTYLIIDGPGNLGLQVAHCLAASGATSIMLIGYSNSNPAVNSQVMELEQKGVQFLVTQTDLLQVEQIAQVIAEVEHSLSPLRGVIQCAGVLDNGALLQQDWQRFSQAMMPTIAVSWYLHELTQDMQLDFFILFSSIASLLGRLGQAPQASANAFLDALAYWRWASGLPALSINWDGWNTMKIIDHHDSGKLSREEEVNAIAPQQSLQLLGQLLFYNSAQIAVIPPPLIPKITNQAQQKLESLTPQISQFTLPDQLRKASPNERQVQLIAYIEEQVAKVLGLDSFANLSVDSKQPLTSFGLSSLMLIELREIISNDVKVEVPPEKLFQNPSIIELAQELAQQLAV